MEQHGGLFGHDNSLTPVRKYHFWPYILGCRLHSYSLFIMDRSDYEVCFSPLINFVVTKDERILFCPWWTNFLNLPIYSEITWVHDLHTNTSSHDSKCMKQIKTL